MHKCCRQYIIHNLKLTELENQYFKLIEGKIQPKEFEEWVFQMNPKDSGLTEEKYLTLLEINYSNPSFKYKVKAALKEFIDYQKYTTITLIQSLEQILNEENVFGCKYELSNNEFGQLFYVSLKFNNECEITFNTTFPSILPCESHKIESTERVKIYNSKLPNPRKIIQSLLNLISSHEVRIIIPEELIGTSWWDYGSIIEERDSEIKVIIWTNNRGFDLRVDKSKIEAFITL